MKPSRQPAAASDNGLLHHLFAGLFGGFLGLALLKFGSPPIFDKFTAAPANIWEFLINSPWPIVWAYRVLGVVGVVGLLVARRNVGAPRWLISLPLAWLVWQFAAGTESVSGELTRPTLWHFTACAVCFYLGYFALGRVRRLTLFWLALLCGFLLVLAVGWRQHFGGLEETRRYFYAYVYPELKDAPPEYLKKISSNRIFSTLFYANTLAGALLLLLPPLLAFLWGLRAWFTAPARAFLVGAVTLGAAGCLYWSGSKAGWLLMLLLGLVALLRLPFARQLKLALVALMLLAGLAGFFWKYSGFFRKGATSVVARFDYWRAATQIAAGHPVFGTGPGTFAIPYQRIKRPESEMARLVHNDYLEQASDSGVPGFALYTTFIGVALVFSFRKTQQGRKRDLNDESESLVSSVGRARSPAAANSRAERPATGTGDWQSFAIWLGVFGWALQGLVEFCLYIPALAWPALAFLGLLLSRNSFDKR